MDAYNETPTSMKAALESLSEIEGTTIAILGDMFEMGTCCSRTSTYRRPRKVEYPWRFIS
jgi:UDP-N-acetylmuramyl pentapeptide synthase